MADILNTCVFYVCDNHFLINVVSVTICDLQTLWVKVRINVLTDMVTAFDVKQIGILTYI